MELDIVLTGGDGLSAVLTAPLERMAADAGLDEPTKRSLAAVVQGAVAALRGAAGRAGEGVRVRIRRRADDVMVELATPGLTPAAAAAAARALGGHAGVALTAPDAGEPRVEIVAGPRGGTPS